jgi:tyrosine ammonia-lyase
MTNHPPIADDVASAALIVGASGGALSLSAFAEVAAGHRKIAVHEDAYAGITKARSHLERCIAENRVVYGVTTGFGPLADRSTPSSRISELQRNLIYHLATGVGAPLGYAEARGLLFARLLSILGGASGASPVLVDLMVAVLNADLAPFVPEKGTVGASGDLTPSAHMALALMGEGAFVSPSGAINEGDVALRKAGLLPYQLDGRDGLALVNGTSAMTAIAAINAEEARRLAEWTIAASAIHAEALHGVAEAWHPAFGEVRPHPGQIEAQQKLLARVDGSKRMRFDFIADKTRGSDKDEPTLQANPQDPYSIRCLPQIFGAILDVLAQHAEVVSRELNAVTDNPLFIEEAPHALHGGNFFGQHVAFVADHLANAISMLAVTAERQLARITDARQSGLPAFLQPHETGLHSGLMGAQVTASALIAEIRSKAIPASIQSIPTNGNNQDIVSMGTIAARRCRDILVDARRVVAINLMAGAQAMDVVGVDSGFSPAAMRVQASIRKVSAFILHDRPLSRDIEAISQFIALVDPPQ